MLQEIINYIQEHKTVNLLEISYRFGIDKAVLEGMIYTLQSKGYIGQVDMGYICSSKKCGECSSNSCLKFYQWLNPDNAVSALSGLKD